MGFTEASRAVHSVTQPHSSVAPLKAQERNCEVFADRVLAGKAVDYREHHLRYVRFDKADLYSLLRTLSFFQVFLPLFRIALPLL